MSPWILWNRRLASALLVASQVSATLADSVLTDVSSHEPALTREHYRILNWTTEKGLPQNTIQCLLQTRDGYLWVGTRHGLARFDGEHFTVFDDTTHPTLRHTNCRALAEDQEGRLLLGTSEGLVCIRNGAAEFLPLPGKPTECAITSILCRPDQSIWLATDSGFWILKGQKFSRLGDPLHALGALCSAPNDQASIWAVVSEHLLRIFPPSNHQDDFRFDVGQASTLVPRTILADSQGRVWFSGGSYLGCWTGGQIQQFTFPGGGFARVAGLAEDHEGHIWVGTAGGGLLLMLAGETIAFKMADGLADNDVECVYTDREGNVWAGTDSGGLNCLQPRKVQNYSTRDGLISDDVWSVSQAGDGSLWVGTGRGVSHFVDGRFRNYPVQKTNGAEAGPPSFVIEDGLGTVWTGGVHGPARFDGRRFVSTTDHTPLTVASSAWLDADGVPWWAGEGAIMKCQQGQWSVEASVEPPSPHLVGILKDRLGRLWVGSTLRGLFCLDGKHLTNLTQTDGLTSNYVAPVLADPDGTIWAASDRGLNRIHDGHITRFTAAEGLAEDIVLNVLEDDYGWFWLNGHHGIHRIRKQDLVDLAEGKRQSVQPISYGEADGMLSSEGNGGSFPNSCKTRDGRLWFPTTRGLVMIDPKLITSHENIPPVHIERVLANNRIVFDRGFSTGTSPPKLRLKPGQGRALEVRYTACGFTAPEATTFKYRLNGENPDWVEVGPERRAVYTDLAPGAYRFEVMARTSHGLWSTTGDGIEFVLEPFFFQTWWFYSACGSAVILAFLAMQAYRLGVQRRILALRHEAGLAHERERIARDMHDDLGSSLTKIKLLSELAKREISRPPELRSHLERISETSHELARDMDEIVWAVNPRNDKLNKLADYLSRSAEEYLRLFGIRCRLSIPPDLPELPLSAELRHGIFLVVKEALHNAVKHAHPAEVLVALSYEHKQLRISVEDDGDGFDLAVASTDDCDGLVNMRRRAEALGGQLELRSSPKHGTRVDLVIRMPHSVG